MSNISLLNMDGKDGSSKVISGVDYPKRIFRYGDEPQVKQINNSCRMSILTRIKDALPTEYEQVKSDPVFANLFAIYENGLGYSARLIHSIMCRQLITDKKHELWFVFGRKPVRFSMQEYNAVTGLKCKDDFRLDLKSWNEDSWKKDKGFWARLLKRDGEITIKRLMDVHLLEVHKWEPEDKLRFVYVCVIAGLVMAKDEKKKIPLSYIKLVMDLDKLRAYPWGLHSFDYLVTSIMDTRKELKKTNSYILNGFSFALQVWVMEAIPVIGELLGEKINKEFTNVARCSNWKGAAKVSYQDIIIIEQSIGPKDIVYPYISRSGIFDIIDDVELFRRDEIDDVGVKNVNHLVQSGYDFRDHEWGHVESNDVEEEKIEEVVNKDDHVEKKSDGDNQLSGLESSEKKQDVDVGASSTKKRKTKQIDHGAESRKMQFLCQRAATSFTHGFDEEMKSFIKGMFEASFKPFKEEIGQRLKKMEEDVSEVKEILSTIASTSTQATPPSFKPKDVGKSPSVQPKSLEDNFLFDDLFTKSGAIDLNIDSQDLLGTQDFLAKTVGHLSQKQCVPGVDPPIDAGKYDEDADLVFVFEVRWNALEAWQRNHSYEQLKFGPSVINHELLNRVITHCKWLHNPEMDAMMYLFREKTSLGEMKADRVGFMNCMFSERIKVEYTKYLKTKRQHKWDSRLLEYANGEFPSHGKTGKQWGTDVDRIYAPICVNGNHWISVCVNFVLRTVEVFDCAGHKNRRYVECFATCIPRILKEINAKVNGKASLLTPYKIIDMKMLSVLNKSHSDCRVYALKYIECHMKSLSLDLMSDENIKYACLKIAVDLWEAAKDPILLERMKNYVPPKSKSHHIEID